MAELSSQSFNLLLNLSFILMVAYILKYYTSETLKHKNFKRAPGG